MQSSCFASAFLRSVISLNDILTEEDAQSISGLEFSPPHKIDENFWKNREQIEEMLYLLDTTVSKNMNILSFIYSLCEDLFIYFYYWIFLVL